MYNKIWDKKILYTASLITLDMCNLENQVKILTDNNMDLLHVDILDGYFSPSMPLGLDLVRQLRSKTNIPFDCHLMVNEHQFFVDSLLDIGVDQIVFQIETASHVDGMLNYIHSKGIRAGVALKPGTSLTVLDYILEKCDTVLLMLINPGFAFMKGEKQVDYADKKIRDLKKMIDDRRLNTKISIDGRISPENIKTYGNGIVQQFVLGSTCLDKNHLAESIQKLTK